MRYAMIMAGGAGTRLWPLSRGDQPKQLLPFIGGRSLLEISAGRVESLVDPGHLLICTAERYRAPVQAGLPALDDEQILGEPAARNTANAVGFTAAVLARRDPDAIFAVLTADHIITPEDVLQQRLATGFDLVEADASRMVTFSINPTRPATGYGYVRRGAAIQGFDGAFQTEKFVEKPTLDKARLYVADVGYGWNSGMFVFHAGTYMKALQRFLPDAYAGLTAIADAWDTPDRIKVLNETYPELPAISVDYAVMEPATTSDEFSVCVVTMDVNWLDVGSWPTYGESLDADAKGNRTNTKTVHVNSSNVLCVSDAPDHTIATIGCEDLIIVRTADATLVCRADQAERVKEVVERLEDELR